MNSDRRPLDSSRQELLRLLLAKKPETSGENSPKFSPTSSTAKGPHGEGTPASAAQRRLWFLDQFGGPDPAYNSPFLLTLTGPLDEQALTDAVNDLVGRHEVLRTAFGIEADEVVQVVAPEAAVPHTVVDLSGLDPADAESRAREEIGRAARLPFALDTAPLLRTHLFRLPGDLRYVLLNVHHSVTDGWSEDILFSELERCYTARAEGGAPRLPAPARQYADYARWEAGHDAAQGFDQQVAYWADRLTGATAPLRLPYDRTRPARPSTDGDSVHLDLPLDLQRRLLTTKATHGHSPYTVFAAALSVVLSDHTERPGGPVVLGAPVANRASQEWESTVGFFVNTLALRVEPGPESTLAELLDQVRTTVVEGLAHQEVPFDRVVDALGVERVPGVNPLFQVMCTVNEAPKAPSLGGVGVTLTELETGTAKFDLEFKTRIGEDGVESWLEYPTELFDRRTIETLADRVRTVLTALVDEPGRRIGTLSLLSADERSRLAPATPAASAPDPAPAGPGSEGAPEAPRTATERAVADIWSDVLGLPDLTRDQDFFHSGGNSLMATKVMIRVRRLWDVSVTVRLLFEAPVLRAFAEAIDDAVGAPAEDAPAAAPVTGTAATDPEPRTPLVPRDRPLPLSFGQERLWFIDQLEPPSSAYHIPYLCEVRGTLDVDALERAANRVVARHEVLRTRVAVVDGAPAQLLVEDFRLPVPVVDLSGEGLDTAVSAAHAFVDVPFDLTAGPPLRAVVHRLGSTHHVVTFCWHHSVFDGWSTTVFLRELADFYREEAGGPAADVPELPLQYADYAAWQRQSLSGEQLTGQLEYWKEQLDGAPALSGLPPDHARPPVRAAGGAGVSAALPADLVERLEKVARDADATLYMTLLAAFQVLLLRNGGQQDMVVGATVANRQHPDSEQLIGFFVNTLALRADVSGDPSFHDLLGRVRGGVLGALAHQDLPLDKLAEALRPDRSLSYNPLFQVAFDLMEEPEWEPRLADLTTRPLAVADPTSLFDLTMVVARKADGWVTELQYSTDLFRRSTMERLLERWEVLLRGIVDDPAARLSGLPVLTSGDRSLIATASPGVPQSLRSSGVTHELFEAVARRDPAAVALEQGSTRLTYGELDVRANQLAHRLVEVGVRRGDRVMLRLDRSPEMVIAALATMKAGAAYLPVDGRSPEQRLAHIAENARAAAVVTTSHVRDDSTALAAIRVDLDSDHEAIRRLPGTPPDRPVGPGDAAYVIYTSGSTGRPNGVEVAHGSLVNLIEWRHADYGLGPADRSTWLGGIAFDISVGELWPMLTAGGTVCMFEPGEVLSGPEMVRWLYERDITVTDLVTPLAETVLETRWPADSRLRLLFTGGDALRRRPLPDAPFQLINCYGPTETTVESTVAVIGPAPSDGTPVGSPPIGRPLANTVIHVLDASFDHVGPGVPGEVFIGGAGVATGYVRNPSLTAARFVPDPFGEPGARLYRTGDLARWLPDGQLEYLGRIDTQVKIRGHRIELDEIESALLDVEGVRDAVVTARRSETLGTYLVAHVVPARPSAPLGEEELRERLAERLPDYMVPPYVVFLPELPLNRSGKVDRAALPAPQRRPEREVTEPRTAEERVIAGIWQELLGLDRVDVHESFFSLGGHSLLATRVVAEIRSRLGRTVGLARFFDAPTVAGLASAALAARDDAAEEPKVVRRARTRRTTTRTLSDQPNEGNAR
ncbi:amino acid adenylation domain-containing protein [Streptomyces sp. NPDC004284]|uniref:amino acid adenylation domain-containing protein n=1 Tax=Streptomyces sp. NPDC004284 TaxID=3364695 RepID=UPI0036A44B2F